MRRNLTTKGLSLSQAQSISNLCFQRSQDIASQLSGINNYSRTLEHGGKTLTETVGKKLPEDIKVLILEKGKLHACQAFLMEHIKLKDKLILGVQKKPFVATKDLVAPKTPEYKDCETIPQVVEDWGWNQLTNAERNEFLESEAYAAHIGQFIHKGSVLDKLRAELPTIKTLEWIEIKKDDKVPLTVTVHHTSEELLGLHNELAAEHRKHEQRVNYFKAKVKNLVTSENARIANVNAQAMAEVNAHNEKARGEFQKLMGDFNDNVKKERQLFEKKRQEEIKEIAGLRIDVDPRFQPVIDTYMKQVESTPEDPKA